MINRSVTVLTTFFLLVIVHSMGYCQTQSGCRNEKLHINCVDSLGNKIGVWIEYDIENIKCSETKYSSQYKVEYTNYFTRDGKEINVYSWKISPSSISTLIGSIKSKFNYDDFSAGSGVAILLLIVDCNSNVFEIRIIKGLTAGFNQELLSVTKILEKNLIPISPDDFTIPIVTPFAIRTN